MAYFVRIYLRMSIMQRKKLIAVGIALALQTYYLPAIAADSSDDDNDCPTDISVLSKAERNKLSARSWQIIQNKTITGDGSQVVSLR